MNIYSCWYKGNLGYCCRQHNLAWMFVPELGQVDNNVYKNVDFEDIVFKNTFAKNHEKNNQAKIEKPGAAGLLYKILRKTYKPRTIGGMLFCSMNF